MFKEIPAQFDFPAAEKETLAFWQQQHIYEKSLEQRRNATPFVFYEGPPTANGKPHPGHCLTRIVKDVFPRYKTMTGHYCPRKGGWDTHGLPVEVEVCKELGIHTKEEIEEYGIEKFIQLCQKSVFRYTREWEELTRRLGFWINLDEAYVTYHQSYVESVWWALSTLFRRGLLYQGHKVVWWWPQGGTALSAGEVGEGYRDVDDPSITIRFRIPSRPGVNFLAWTTTPWTLPSNVALAIHPDEDYVQIAIADEEQQYILAAARVEEVFRGLPVDPEKDIRIVEHFRGNELLGLEYEPLFNYKKPENGKSYVVIAADFVTLDTGTGIVHIAPAFGEDDYRIAQENNLGFLQLIAPDGTFVPEAVDFAGRFCKEADGDIIRKLKADGALIKREQVRHPYPFCPRAEKDPLIQYARKSWFIRTTQFKEAFLRNNQAVSWLPEHIRDGRFGNFLSGNVDWALSRERFWGTPLPIWECTETGQRETIARYDELLAKPGVSGMEVWEKAKQANPDLVDDLKVHKPYIDAITYDSPFAVGARMHRVPEVIDCWFDSGCMPFAQWGYPHQGHEDFNRYFPADFISEAIDQTRGWFYTLLAISTMLFSESEEETATAPLPRDMGAQPPPHPFRNCIVLGLVAGEDGRKLSKRLRNYKEPQHIFDREGTDAMRWSMLSSQPPWNGAKFKEENIAGDQREFLIKLYNVYSFFVIYANIDQWTPHPETASDAGNELDRWLLAELNQTIADVRAQMDTYQSYPACRRLVTFVDALSNWYVRRSRDRFWRAGMDADKDAAYATLWTCLTTTARLIAPFTPFFAENLYRNLEAEILTGAAESVHLCDYPLPNPEAIDRELLNAMALVRELVSLGRAARMDAGIKVRQPLPVVEVILAAPETRDWLNGHLDLIREELNVKDIEFPQNAEDYVRYDIRPNFKAIGPRWGKLVPKIKKALADADAAALRRDLDQNGQCELKIEGQSVELTSDEVEIRLAARDGWAAAQGSSAVVILSTEIPETLRREGRARELIHLIQNVRKNMRLAYQDRIQVTLDTADPALREAVDAHRAIISAETLTTELRLAALPEETEHREKIDGAEVAIQIEIE